MPTNMFYRHKILLALLQKWGGFCNALDFQKILFLFSDKQRQSKQRKSAYNFIPYLYGCFSFQSYADKRVLTRKGLLFSDDAWRIREDSSDFFSSLIGDDRDNLGYLYNEIRHLRGNDLLKYIYKKHPYYAIHSNLLNNVLTEKEIEIVKSNKPKDNNFTLFTLGYQGYSIDEYLNILIQNNMKILCDVRRNAISMKYGFSKKTLGETVEKLGIKYLHIPELGIDSDQRKNLKTVFDYEQLFTKYKENILPQKQHIIQSIFNIFLQHKRMALTCFEKDYHYCHRHKVVEALSALPIWHYSIQNL